jgi:hypothetical protein
MYAKVRVSEHVNISLNKMRELEDPIGWQAGDTLCKQDTNGQGTPVLRRLHQSPRGSPWGEYGFIYYCGIQRSSILHTQRGYHESVPTHRLCQALDDHNEYVRPHLTTANAYVPQSLLDSEKAQNLSDYSPLNHTPSNEQLLGECPSEDCLTLFRTQRSRSERSSLEFVV